MTTPDELTRLREEVARLTRERDEAHAKYLGAIEANEEWHQVVIKLRAAIAPTEANVRIIGDIVSEAQACGHCDGTCAQCAIEATAILAAINERAKL